MRIADITWRRFEMRLREPLVTAHGVLVVRPGVLVRMCTKSGLAGFGETMPLPGFHAETVETVLKGLPPLVALLRGADARDLAGNLERLRDAPPALAGCLDLAMHDLVGRLEGRPVVELLGGRARPVAISVLVSGDSPHAVAECARRATAEGYRALKLKVGSQPLEVDLARVAALREAAGPEIAMRLDANCAWSEEQAARALDGVAPFAPEMVEQPVEADDLAALARVRAGSPVPVAADEAVRNVSRALEILERGAADVLVLKPGAIGGLDAAAQVARAARSAGVDTLVTSSLDSAVGVAGALHLAASLPTPTLAAGLATDTLFESDFCGLPTVAGGIRSLPAGSGLGVVPSEPRE